MVEYLNWVTLLGVALIVGGLGLLAGAVGAARTLSPARHRQRVPDPLDRLERGGSGVFTRGVAPAVLAHPAPSGEAVGRQPDIRRSALLADTMRLNQVPPMSAGATPGGHPDAAPRLRWSQGAGRPADR